MSIDSTVDKREAHLAAADVALAQVYATLVASEPDRLIAAAQVNATLAQVYATIVASR